MRTSRMHTAIRSVEAAIASGDGNAARTALQAAQPVIMSNVSKGVLKLGTASRKMSRLSARVKAVCLAAA